MNDETTRYASRKFLLTVVVLVAATTLLAIDMISDQLWSDTVKWTLGLYFGANVLSWATDALKGRP